MCVLQSKGKKLASPGNEWSYVYVYRYTAMLIVKGFESQIDCESGIDPWLLVGTESGRPLCLIGHHYNDSAVTVGQGQLESLTT